MKYFKNTELAKLYNVSEKSVRNWIQAASEGKLDLQLHAERDRPYIANTSHNTRTIELLAEKGKKYRNGRGFKVIYPTKKFYDTFSSKQIFDIISNLTIHRELPLKYSYVDGGAEYWDKYVQRLSSEQSPNMFTSTVDLLDTTFDDLARLLESHKQVNVIDLGPGNGLPVKRLLSQLKDTGRLKRYIAIDISKEMLEITGRNVEEWFKGEVSFEGYIRDIGHERFDDLFAEDYAGDDVNVPVNLILLLGGTLCNLRSPAQALQAISNSLSLQDIMVYSTKLDTPNSRRYFDFNISQASQELTPRHQLTLNMLNIDSSLYEVEQYFDKDREARFISIRLKVALSIEFKLANGTRVVNLNKDDSILLWRYWHQNAIEIIQQFDNNDFDLQFATKSKDQEYLLLASKVKHQD
jgi:uncharacterized SAM-dependent methyltransferase